MLHCFLLFVLLLVCGEHVILLLLRRRQGFGKVCVCIVQGCGDIWKTCVTVYLGVSSGEKPTSMLFDNKNKAFHQKKSASGPTIYHTVKRIEQNLHLTPQLLHFRVFLHLHIISAKILSGYDAKVVEITTAQLLQNPLHCIATFDSV